MRIVLASLERAARVALDQAAPSGRRSAPAGGERPRRCFPDAAAPEDGCVPGTPAPDDGCFPARHGRRSVPWAGHPG